MSENEFLLRGYEDLEISTQVLMREAFRRGIHVEVLDRRAHFLRLTKGEHAVIIKEASKTALDSYLTFLIMEDKAMTKLILGEHGIRTPGGAQYHSLEAALDDFERYRDRPIVTKPVDTNFGLGITTMERGAVRDLYERGLRVAFDLSPAVIVEDFYKGGEYRFLIIGGQCVAVCNRVPANVIGDGDSTIAQLVEKKNQDPRRGEGHKTPLERIQLEETELHYLKTHALESTSVPGKGEQIFLRRNSNISTGGDSIDVTEDISADYLDVAVRAAEAVHARICGVDMIINNPDVSVEDETNSAILELNFNPVLYIHEHPYEGKPRNVTGPILDLLGF